jgi:ribosomal protein S18 acetylase RimI-like enzyme
MRLRYALIACLAAGAAAAGLLALDISRRLGAFGNPLAVIEGFRAAATPYLIVLAALAVLNLAALLLLVAALREEGARVLQRARSSGAPPGADSKETPEEEASGATVAAPADISWQPQSWGTLAPWTPDLARPCADFWLRVVSARGPGWPREGSDFEKLFSAREFDGEAGAVARAADGSLIGLLLALRQPSFEESRYWWLESPGVLAAVLVDPAQRRRGIGSALVRHFERSGRRKRRPRLFAGGLEEFPQLAPGVPADDHAARTFFLALGYRELRHTCHMEADLAGFQPPRELVEREARLKEQGFSFTPAASEDLDALRGFLNAVPLPRPQRRIEKFAQAPECFVLARKEGRIAGFVQVRPIDQRGSAGLDTIYFAPEHRGVGLGSLLLVKAHEAWKRLAAARASVWTYPEAAERFYPRAGFKTVQEWVCCGKELEHSWNDPAYVERWR